ASTGRSMRAPRPMAISAGPRRRMAASPGSAPISPTRSPAASAPARPQPPEDGFRRPPQRRSPPAIGTAATAMTDPAGRVLWAETGGEQAGYPVLEGEAAADVAVI